MPETKSTENEQNSKTELSGDTQEKGEKAKKIFLSAVQQEFYKGPLPSPDTLKKYNDMLPDAADRIFKMAERSQVHRENIECQQMDIIKARVESESKKINKGQNYAFIIALTGIAGAITCAFIDQVTIGSVLGGSTVVTLAALFLSEKWRRKKDKKNEAVKNLPTKKEKAG
jgi:uncharacterized membrane protein